MNRLLIIICTLATAFDICAQPKGKDVPVLKEIAGLSVIKEVYPTAVSVEKANAVWFRIKDSKNETIGYALSSKPFTTDIKGYHDATPVVIVMDLERIIQRVAILSHYETAGFIKKLERQQYFNNWNGLTPDKALVKKSKADSYSGATISARALDSNVELVLKLAVQNKLAK